MDICVCVWLLRIFNGTRLIVHTQSYVNDIISFALANIFFSSFSVVAVTAFVKAAAPSLLGTRIVHVKEARWKSTIDSIHPHLFSDLKPLFII